MKSDTHETNLTCPADRSCKVGESGLSLTEPFLWERGEKGRSGMSLPEPDVPDAGDTRLIEPELIGDGPDFPDLSEVEVVRHYTRLSHWNYGVDTGMYPLGSCTMKYNPKINEAMAALPGFAGAHPLQPEAYSQGALRLMHELATCLCEITGMDAVTLQPAAGAHGELAGMLIIHAWLKKKGEPRSKILVPDTAHGTNPASAALCGFKPVPVASNAEGILSVASIEQLMDTDTAGIMVTNPNTLGLYEANLKAIAEIVHDRGGLVYGDGANMNAVMGQVRMSETGVDILHLNLHKTFSTPHGGGGPGAGPVAVRGFLEPFLPVPRIEKTGEGYRFTSDHPDTIGRLLSFYGHVAVMVRAYAYILSMGGSGLATASQYAVLNANYIKEALKSSYQLAYDRPCLHESVFSDARQAPGGVTALDIAKRLIDYGFHPPTIYFPLVVPGAIMIEPTETETKEDLDRFIEAMKSIAREAAEHPEGFQAAPQKARVTRLDETGAARKPRLCG